MNDKTKTKAQLIAELEKSESGIMTKLVGYFTVERNVIGFSLLLGLLIWIIDAIFDPAFPHELSFIESLITKTTTHELYTRSFIVVCFLIFSIIISRILVKRKEAEEEIKNLSKFPSENPNPVLRINIDGEILYSNEAVDSLLKDVKLSEDQIYKILPNNLKKLVKESLETGEAMSYLEAQVDSIVYSYSLTPVIKNNYVNLYGKDISEQKKYEEELLLNSEMIKNMTEGVYLVGIDDVIIKYTNPKFEEMFGYNAGEMIGKHASIVNAITDKDPLERAKEIMKVIRETGEWHGEVNNIKKDGTPFWCYANGSVFDHPFHGKVLISVHTDITERKQIEESLREENELNLALFEHNPIETIAVDTEGRITNFNLAKKKSGDRLPAIGDVMYRDYAGRHEIDMYTVLLECIRTNNSKDIPDNKYGDKFIAINIAPFPHGAAITSQDITERKQAEESLKTSESLLRQQKSALEQKTIALREVIGQIEVEKNEIKDDITTNVKKVILPIMEKIRLKNPSNEYIDFLWQQLEQLTSSFVRKITHISPKLTLREIEICSMIEYGHTNKEISGILNITCQTVEQHRKNIRNKLDISNKNINLASFLQQLSS